VDGFFDWAKKAQYDAAGSDKTKKGIKLIHKPDADQAPGIFKHRTGSLPFTFVFTTAETHHP